MLADPELDSDFFGADFSAAGFAAGVVGAVVVDSLDPMDSLDPVDSVEPELVESDCGLAGEDELSAERESVR